MGAGVTRDELSALCLSFLKPISGGSWTTNYRTMNYSGGSWTLNPDALADAIIAAGWRYDGSCRDCQANLDTNGGRHQFWCQTEAGKAQWADEQHE